MTVTWGKDSDGNDIKEEFLLTTSEDSLSKRLNQKLVSQFGVAVPAFRVSDRTVFRPSLMLSMYYHPRALNPDIPTRAYQLWAPQRFSILTGVTLTSLAVPRQRENLLGSNNIVLGVGYQLVDAVRFSYGALLFKEVNPNPILSARREIKSTPYISVTLDIKLKDLFGGIFTALGFK